MKARAQTSTDIAAIGVWDAARQTDVLKHGISGKGWDQAIEEDKAAATLCVIQTGADGSDDIDVYVDEPPPAGVLANFRQRGVERRLNLRSGRLATDGLEYYRANNRDAPLQNVIPVPPGDYGLVCLVNRDEELSGDQPSWQEVRALVGEEDHRYFERVQRRGALGCWVGLLMPVLWWQVGMMWAFGSVLAVMLAWSHLHEWLVKRDARYQDIVRRRVAYWQKAQANAPATLLLVLRRLEGVDSLAGGTIELQAEADRN